MNKSFKQIFLYAMLGFVVLIIGMSAIPNWSPLPSAGSNMSYSGTMIDTISNTEIDTISPGFLLTSPWQYSIHLRLTHISGTRAMKIYLQESNVVSGNTDWFSTDSITPTTAVNTYMLKGTNVWGRRQRLYIRGNTGATQVERYSVDMLYKRTK